MDTLDIIALTVLSVLVLAGVALAAVFGMLPGRIARSRGHPQAEAINVCGWWGILTMGVLLPVAYIWAYTITPARDVEPLQQNVPQLEAAYQAAESRVKEAIARRDLAKLDYARAKKVASQDSGAVSKRNLDLTQQTLRMSEAALGTAQANALQTKLAWESQIVPSTVVAVLGDNPQAQLPPSGEVPAAPSAQTPIAPYGVVLELDRNVPELKELRGGAIGSAAIYTSSVKPTHLIRRVMIRMQTWLNFIVPT